MAFLIAQPCIDSIDTMAPSSIGVCPVDRIQFDEGNDVPAQLQRFADLNEPSSADAAATPAKPGDAVPDAAATPAAPADGFKYGENGVEGKCSLCGTYVNKGGVRFQKRSVLCPGCAGKPDRIGSPYQRAAGRR